MTNFKDQDAVARKILTAISSVMATGQGSHILWKLQQQVQVDHKNF